MLNQERKPNGMSGDFYLRLPTGPIVGDAPVNAPADLYLYLNALGAWRCCCMGRGGARCVSACAYAVIDRWAAGHLSLQPPSHAGGGICADEMGLGKTVRVGGLRSCVSGACVGPRVWRV